MNQIPPRQSFDPFLHPLDAILADIAIAVQLPPGLHQKACVRYEAIRQYVERPGSPLEGEVDIFYPHGSMAIDATISTRGTDDEYDLDVIAQLRLHHLTAPNVPLDLLEAALKGYPVDKPVNRQTRCVTVTFADGMHVDVTPASRLPNSAERASHIFHAKRGNPASEHYHVPMNAYGFGCWYTDRTPIEPRFAMDFARRYYESAGMQFRAAAEHEDVPAQTPLIVKNTATVALQLQKRFRNIQYADATGRIPPSVMLSCYAGRAATPNMSLSSMLVRQCHMMLVDIYAATNAGRLINVENPIFPADTFTDRWPENIAQQNEWAQRVAGLARTIEDLKAKQRSQEELRDVLRGLFGDGVVSRGLMAFNERMGAAIQAGRQDYTSRGSVFVSAKPAIVASTVAITAGAARAHTFMGGRL